MINEQKRNDICIIKATGEEKNLVALYDDSIVTGLIVHEAILGKGKFIGWRDKENNIDYKPEEVELKALWPYELYGIECHKGWHELLKPAINYIEEYNESHPDNKIQIQQIKEKFGELRFYVSHTTDELKKLISDAEDIASRTCEECGSTEDVGITVDSWNWTCCKKCLLENIKQYPRTRKWKSFKDDVVYNIDENTEN